MLYSEIRMSYSSALANQDSCLFKTKLILPTITLSDNDKIYQKVQTSY